MKSSLLQFCSLLLALFTVYTGDLKANQECTIGIEPVECTTNPDNALMPSLDNPCYPPDWLYCYNITQTSATWSWEACYGANSYSIQWRYPGGSWYNLPGVCYQTWINVTNLDPCASYEWRVRTNCSYGYYSSWCYPYSFNTYCNYCETPYGCSTTNITDYSATFHWSEIWGATSYQVQIRLPGGSWTYVANSPCYDNWITVNYLDPSTSYEWRVRACCSYYSYSDWTYPNYFTTGGSSYCHYPDWLQCYNITGYSATWKWAPVYGADYYDVQWRYPGGSWYTLSGGPFHGTWVNVNHLQPCTTYEWRVKSHCGYGYKSTWCNPYIFKTTCNNCPTPSGLITKDIGDKKATLKWSPVYGASSYSVQIKDAYGNWYDVAGSPTTGTWIIAGNLVPCKTYQWRVRANCYNYESYSYWSKPKSFTTTCGHGCNAPEWVYTSGISPSSATLHWASVYGADYYVVEWRLSGGQWYELPSGPWTNTWAEMTGLNPNTTYEWRVKSHCPGGQYSYWSSVTYFNTSSGSSCGMPFWRYTLPITDSTATFHWSSVSGAMNYTVQIRLINGPWQDVVGSPTADTSITAKGLLPNTSYEWRMQVNCSHSTYSYWLSPITFFTGKSGCDTPGSLYVDLIKLYSATLNWAPVQGALTYSVEIRVLPSGAWNPVPGSPVDTNAVVVDGLNPFTPYEWRVKANCTGGFHSFVSYPVQFTTTDLPSCNAPGGLAASNITETTASFRWSQVQGAQGYHVQSRLPNGTWVDFPGGIVNDTTILVTGFTPNTTYEWRVRTACGLNQYSNWSSTGTFTTIGIGPGSDDCTTAILLTVETSCVTTYASNINASASNPPPVGGCWINGYKDVWFKFTMPDVSNPAVTIRTTAGSLANAVMEVYTGTDCNIMSLIACEDNNDNGNGSSMPVINLTGTPNATIWVRVWGYDGSTGTFSICVFNSISVNYSSFSDLADPVEGGSLDKLEAVAPDITESNGEMHISPNPVSDVLDVVVQQTESNRVVGLRILDLSGKDVFTQKIEPAPGEQFLTDVDVSNLVPGIYVLQVQTTRGVLAEKISVIRR